MTEKLDYDLTCWYTNLRRIAELVSNSVLDRYLSPNKSSISLYGPFADLAILAAAKDALVDWMRKNKPSTLEQLIVEDKITNGRIFTHYSDFYCKGLPQYQKAKNSSSSSVPLPQIYSKLDPLLPNVRLNIKYHPEHLTSDSAWSMLSGRKQLFVLAAIDKVGKGTITVIPYIVATLLPDLNKSSLKGMRWSYQLEMFIEGIDQFALVENEPTPTNRDLKQLKDIPEKDIKQAFAEIIGEPTIPKDWGGEKSDLFSTYVTIEQERISTAFAFKGPSQFKPMTMAECGKNGDQIDRLFSEPADLLILQHCHEITTAVRNTMRAYATRIGEPKLFALINGYDTIRILRAYSKCRFRPTTIYKE
ncbi:hypothetical protein ACFL6S_32755 [Candidatus Poribacteria bacterium]